MIKIYTLADPETGKIRYVGKTIGTLNARLIKHIYDSKKRSKKYHTTNWINSILEKGLKPKIELLDEVLDFEWRFWEKYWISQIKSWGFNLTNHREGGEDGPSGYKQSSEKIQKRLNSLKTSKIWLEFCKNHSKIMKEKFINGEIKSPYENALLCKTKEQLDEIRKRSVETWKSNYKLDPQKKIDRSKWNSIPIIAIFSNNSEKIFNSIADASRELNIEKTSITFICKGKGYQSKGVRFKYKSEELQNQYPSKLPTKHTSKGRISKK